MDNQNIIGARITAALALRNVKQKELAAELGVTDNTISYFCSGRRIPNVQQIIKISKSLNVSCDYLLGLSEEKTTDKATKELCETLGLSESAIELLKNDKEDSLKNAVNFLFEQHYRTIDFEKQLHSWPVEKKIPMRFNNYHSILKELDELIKLCNAENDVSITLSQTGSVSVEWVHDGSMEKIFIPQIEQKIEQKMDVHSTSLLRIFSNNKIEFIRDLLREYSNEQYEKNISSQIWNWVEKQQSREDNEDE